MHRSARGITTDMGSIPGCVTAGRDWETHEAAHIWPTSSWLEEDLACRDVLVPSRYSDSLWRAGHMHAGFGCQLYCFLQHIGVSVFRIK